MNSVEFSHLHQHMPTFFGMVVRYQFIFTFISMFFQLLRDLQGCIHSVFKTVVLKTSNPYLLVRETISLPNTQYRELKTQPTLEAFFS